LDVSVHTACVPQRHGGIGLGTRGQEAVGETTQKNAMGETTQKNGESATAAAGHSAARRTTTSHPLKEASVSADHHQSSPLGSPPLGQGAPTPLSARAERKAGPRCDDRDVVFISDVPPLSLEDRYHPTVSFVGMLLDTNTTTATSVVSQPLQGCEGPASILHPCDEKVP
jgi:hypothetical protein